MPDPSDIAHLLRRTEFVARPGRLAALSALPTREAAVDDVLSVTGDPGSVLPFASSTDSQRVVQLTDFWLNRMAHDSPRPIQERMALFWHGHFCSSDAKVGQIELMRRQIDLFRRDGLGNLRDLAIKTSTTAAMLRYLDNNQNFEEAPNQNFGRELMELFLLGVGNYTENDVVACSEAWTGHADWYRPGDDDYDNGAADYLFYGEALHDSDPKQFLGRTINVDPDAGIQHGAETIHVMLGDPAADGGVVPAGPNAGRPSRDVAAEFLSRKLWRFFAGTEPSPAVVEHLRNTATHPANDFAIRPWLRALLTHPEFYTPAVKQALVRSPIDYVVALLAASGVRSEQGTPWWLMEAMGQRPLFPPNVAGWKHNGYWIGASAFGGRAATARHVAFYVLGDYWDGAGMRLAGGTLSRAEVEATADSPAARQALVGRVADLMQIALTPSTRAALDEFAGNAAWWELHDLVELIFVSPEMNVA